tara:strand:+ start:39 stop:305 length:267 start_codon:yes stop_codon:yes gene_type:complete
MAKVEKTRQQILAENEKLSDQILRDLKQSAVDNMDGEARANKKLNMMMVKLNKVEQRAYDNLKKGEELDMLTDEQKKQLKKLEEKRKE